jgi:hypothetical protein
MLIKKPDDIRSSEITDRKVYLGRRNFMRGAALAASAVATGVAYKQLLAPQVEVATPAARAVGLDPADLAERTTGTVSGDTTVVSIAVRGDTPEEAVAAARSVTRSFVAAVAAIETPQGGQARVRADVVSDPTTPSAPVSLPLVVQALLGLLVGAVLGGLVLLLERASWPGRLAASIRGDDPAVVGAGR